MALGDVIARMSVVLGLDTAAFEKGATQAERQIRRTAKNIAAVGQSVTDLGQRMTIGLTVPIVAFGVAAVKAATESRDALAQVQQTITSMGNAAGRSAEQLQALAGDQMHKSLFDDDEILRKVTTNLLTFGNVSGDVFDRAQQAALDLSARLGQDLQSSAIQVGKALNDPVKGITALQRVGVSFTQQQRDQIKAMTEAGNVAGAQRLILAELSRQFGGAAEAAKQASPFAALKHSFDDFTETVGGKLLPILPRVLDLATRVLDAFTRLPPGVQTAAIAFAAIAAALGPVLIGMGALISTLAPLIAGIQLAFASGAGLTGTMAALGVVFSELLVPIAAVAAAAYLIWRNWDKIAPALAEVYGQVKNELGPALAELGSALMTLWNGPLGQAVRAAAANLLELYLAFSQAMGSPVIATVKVFVTTLTAGLQALARVVSIVAKVFSGDLAGALREGLSASVAAFGALPLAAAQAVQRLVTAVRTWLVDRLSAVWDTVKAKIEQVKQYFFGLYDAVVGHSYVPDMVDGIAAQMLRLDNVMVGKAKSATDKTKAAFAQLAEDIKPLMERLFPEASALNAYRSDSALIDRAEAARALTGDQAREARRRLALGGEGAPIDIMSPGSPPPTGPLADEVRDALDRINEGIVKTAGTTEAANVRIVKSFKDMADNTLSALDRMAGAIKGGGFLDIFSAVIDLGLQLGSIGVFGKKVQGNINTGRGFANGTGFAPGGLAMVGERGPELVDLPRGSRVIPNHKLAGRGRTEVFITPTPYFDAHVDGRAARVAAPMAAASGMHARSAAGGDAARKVRRRIPG